MKWQHCGWLIVVFVSILDVVRAGPPSEKSWASLSASELVEISRENLNIKKFDTALKAAQAALGKDMSNAIAKNLEGLSLLGLNKEAEALEAFRKSIEMNPKIEDGYLGLAQYYHHPRPQLKNFKINYGELRVLYSDLIKNVGEKPSYLAKLCSANFLDGVYEQAVATCQKAVRADLSNPENFLNLGESLMAQGKEKKAQEYFRRAAKNFASSFRAQVLHAQELFEQKNYTGALPFLLKAHELEPQSLETIERITQGYINLQDHKLAAPYFEKACKLNARKTIGSVRRALTYLENQKNVELIEVYRGLVNSCLKEF